MGQVSSNNNNQVITALRQEAAAKPTFSAICTVFAVRERARHQVTMTSLRSKMQKAGWNIPAEDCENALKFLASLGFGTLEHDAGGKVKALTGLKVTLQSIGRAAIDKKDVLDRFAQGRKYVDLPRPREGEAAPMAAAKTGVKTILRRRATDSRVSLNTVVSGQPVTIQLPTDLTAQQLGDVVFELQQKLSLHN